MDNFSQKVGRVGRNGGRILRINRPTAKHRKTWAKAYLIHIGRSGGSDPIGLGLVWFGFVGAIGAMEIL